VETWSSGRRNIASIWAVRTTADIQQSAEF